MSSASPENSDSHYMHPCMMGGAWRLVGPTLGACCSTGLKSSKKTCSHCRTWCALQKIRGDQMESGGRFALTEPL